MPPSHFSPVPARTPPRSNNTTALRGQKGHELGVSWHGAVTAVDRRCDSRAAGAHGGVARLPTHCREMGAWSLSHDDGRSPCTGTCQPLSSFTCRSSPRKTPHTRASLGVPPALSFTVHHGKVTQAPACPEAAARSPWPTLSGTRTEFRNTSPGPSGAAGGGDRSEERSPVGENPVQSEFAEPSFSGKAGVESPPGSGSGTAPAGGRTPPTQARLL